MPERGERLFLERDLEIVRLRAQGRTLREIGNLYDISQERTRQIIAKDERRRRQKEEIARLGAADA